MISPRTSKTQAQPAKPKIPLLDFEEIYIPSQRPDLSFVMKPIQKSNAEAAVNFLADEFIVTEPTGKILGFTREDYYLYLKIQVDKAVELQTGLVMYDQSNGELVAICLCEDYYEPSNWDEKAGEISVSYKEKMAPYTNYLSKPENVPDFLTTPKTRYSLCEISSAATSKKYQGLGIGLRLTLYAMFEHEYLSQAPRWIVYSVSAMTNTHAEKSGWILLKNFPYSTWEVDGVKVFKNLEEIQKKHGLPPTSSLQIWGFDKGPSEPRPAL